MLTDINYPAAIAKKLEFLATSASVDTKGQIKSERDLAVSSVSYLYRFNLAISGASIMGSFTVH